MGNIVVAPPSSALIITRGRKQQSHIQIGGRAFVPFFVSKCYKLSLELRTIRVDSKSAATSKGVMLDVIGICQVKVSGYKEDENHNLQQDDNAIRLAAQHFIGASDESLEEAVNATLEGHQRAILGTLTVEEVYRDRSAFSEQVRKLAEEDMRSMGLEIVSYTIASISDSEGYMNSLGVTQTEMVKRNAQEGRALHQSEAAMKSEQEKLKATLAINDAKQRAAQSDAELALAVAANTANVNREQARADNAKTLEDAILKQRVVVAECEQRRLEAENNVKIEQQQAQINKVRREAAAEAEASTQLIAARKSAQEAQILIGKEEANVKVETQRMEAKRVRVTATAEMEAEAGLIEQRRKAQIMHIATEAELARVQKEAEGVVLKANADAESARVKGLSEAAVMKEKMKVETEKLQLIGEAYGKYNENGVRVEMIKAMPSVAEQIAKPLEKTEKIVFMGGGGSGVGSSAMLQDMTRSVMVVDQVLQEAQGTLAGSLIDKIAEHTVMTGPVSSTHAATQCA
uniref:Band 7 domain-containing protein n=1 Tax=Timspurckia oligopyrenoides TaxID=708627 RepID=A0A7S0ZBA3_9RHOD|mmetsp:Transcript_11142/g.20131  ORF Transcript_11142/g.20131 Transcript_11142/m.20131 type:complete len:517 (+) Transcript_11142:201-1751(+)